MPYWAVLCAVIGTAIGARADDKPVSFSNDVAPVLVTRCQGCHGPDKVKGGYRLDTFDRLKSPGASGTAPFVPSEPDQSALHQLLVTADADERMPKKGEPLPPAEIEVIRRWIEQGATFDGKDGSASITSLSVASYPSAPTVYPRPLPVAAIAFSPDGKTIAAGGYHEVTLWDAATGELRSRIGNLPRRITSIDFSPDGKRLAVAGGEPGTGGEARLVDLDGAAVLDRIGDVMLAVRFSPDGKRVAAGGADNVIRIYDAGSGKRERVIEQHADWVVALAFSPDSKWLASGSRDKSARVFDAATGEMRGAFLNHTDAVTGVAWSSDGSRCISVAKDLKLRSWRPEDGKDDGEKKESKGPDLPATPLAVTAVGTDVFVACADGVVRTYSGDELKWSRDLRQLTDWADAVAVNAGSGRVAAAGHAGAVRVWTLGDGKDIATFTAAPGYSPPGK